MTLDTASAPTSDSVSGSTTTASSAVRRSVRRVPFQNVSLNSTVEEGSGRRDTSKRLLSTPALRVARSNSRATNETPFATRSVFSVTKKQRCSLSSKSLSSQHPASLATPVTPVTPSKASSQSLSSSTFVQTPTTSRSTCNCKSMNKSTLASNTPRTIHGTITDPLKRSTSTPTSKTVHSSISGNVKTRSSRIKVQIKGSTDISSSKTISTPSNQQRKSSKLSTKQSRLEKVEENHENTETLTSSLKNIEYTATTKTFHDTDTPILSNKETSYICQSNYLTAKLSNMSITTPEHCRDVLVPITSNLTSSDSESSDGYTSSPDKDMSNNSCHIPQSPFDTCVYFKESKPLLYVIAYLDIKTTDNNDASSSFKYILTELGATIKDKWNWSAPCLLDTSKNLNKSLGTNDAYGFQSIGITHVIWRSGCPKILEKIKAANNYLEKINETRKIHCVGIGWIMKCEEENKHVNEAAYEIDLTSATISRRKKSIESKTFTSSSPNTSILSPLEKKSLNSKTISPKPFTELERCGLIAAKKKIDFHKPIVSSPLAKKCWTIYSD